MDTLNKSVRVELVETYYFKIDKLQMASTGSARTEGFVQHCLNGERTYHYTHLLLKSRIKFLFRKQIHFFAKLLGKISH